MQIAFKCFDVADDQEIDDQEMKLLLINIPQKIDSRYGNSISDKDALKISELIEHKNYDIEEITQFVKCMYDNIPG